MRVLIDNRWDADTGIGKLYREVMARAPADISPSFVQSRMGLGNLFTPLMLARETALLEPCWPWPVTTSSISLAGP